MWVYTAKPCSDGVNYGKIKGRLTLLGNQERHLLTKLKAYAPVANPSTYKLVLALHVGLPGVKLYQMDISQAYLTTFMKREVYVRHPPGYVLYMDDEGYMYYRLRKKGEQPDTVLPLLRALYGGMECGRLFYDDFLAYHVNLGFVTTHLDQCYLSLEKDG